MRGAPGSFTTRVWVRSYTIPTSRNNARGNTPRYPHRDPAGPVPFLSQRSINTLITTP